MGVILVVLILVAAVAFLMVQVWKLQKTVGELGWQDGYALPEWQGEYLVHLQYLDGAEPDSVAVCEFDGEKFKLDGSGAYVVAWAVIPEISDEGV